MFSMQRNTKVHREKFSYPPYPLCLLYTTPCNLAFCQEMNSPIDTHKSACLQSTRRVSQARPFGTGFFISLEFQFEASAGEPDNEFSG